MDANWMKDLRHLANDYEGKVDEHLLDSIKEEMARRGNLGAPQLEQKHKVVRLPATRRWTVAAAVALAAGMAIWHWLPSYDVASQHVATHAKGNSKDIAQAPGQGPKTEAQVPTHGQMLAVAGSASHYSKTAASPLPLGAALPETSSEATPESTTSSTPTVKPQQDKTSTPQNAKQPTSDRPMGHPNDYAPRSYAWNNDGGDHTVTLGVSLQGTTGSSRTNNGIMLMDAAPIGAFPSDFKSLGSNVLTQSDATISHKAKHDLPVKVGISVRYAINDRWSLISGINYSYLKSTFTSDNGNSHSTTSQKLHYVGLPLGVSYSIWKMKGLNTYVTANGEAEKLVSGKASTTDRTGIIETTSSHNVSEHKLLWSTHAAAGVEYSPVNRVSLYAEPGLTYHFKNGSCVESAYTDKRLRFSLNVGARITFGDE